MNLQSADIRNESRILLYKIILLVIVVTVLTISAYLSYPVWDDAWLELLIKDNGQDAIKNYWTDRPLAAAMVAFLLNRGLLLKVGVIIHWLVWLGMGLVTLRLWSYFFPNHKQYDLLAALLAVAPLLCETQFVIINPIFTAQLGIVLSYLGLLLLLSEHRTRLRVILATLISFSLIIFSTLLSEYALPVVGIGGIFLAAKAFYLSGKERKSKLITIVLLFAVTFVSYLIYFSIGSSTRSSVRPEFAVEAFSWRIKWVPFRMISSLWQGSIGVILSKLGEVNLNSKVAIVGLFCGIVFAVILTLILKTKKENLNVEFPSKSIFITLIIALTVALFPVILMGRVPKNYVESRFWLPMLPVASVLTVSLLLFLLRHKFVWLLPVLCGFLTGYWTAVHSITYIVERQRVAAWSKQIEPYISDTGLTVAIFSDDAFNQPKPRDFELTDRLTKEWLPEKEKRFWAFANIQQANDYKALTGVNFGGIIEAPTVNRNTQGVGRMGAISKILWITVQSNGSIEIRPAVK